MKRVGYEDGLMELFIRTGNIAFMTERLRYLRTHDKTILPPVKEFLHTELNALLPEDKGYNL